MDYDYMRELAQNYKKELTPLLRYLGWLEEHADKSVSRQYDGGEQAKGTMAFPIYDSTLLGFVKEASRTSFMDKNYPYVYSRLQLKGPEDERRAIESATLLEWNVLCGILSKYVLGGMTKGALWTQAVTDRIFYMVLNKMKEIVEFWGKPIGQ